ncbi:MAG: NEW3 domain-containing protein [Bacteroidales bacterium]
MSTFKKLTALFSVLLTGIAAYGHSAVSENDSILLYTPFTKISIPPGEAIDYAIDVINNGNKLETIDLVVTNLPSSWNYALKSGAWNIRQVSVLPGEKKSISLRVEVPFRVNKGNYRFYVSAGSDRSLPLTVNISEQGTFKTEFITRQANMEGHSGSAFTYSAELRNRTAEKLTYALQGEVPKGWTLTFSANGKQVTSVEVEPNATIGVGIEVKPSEQVEEGRYAIPIRAMAGSSSGDLALEAVITGSFKIELTTPTGLLSTNITAGEEKKIDLVVKNTGSSILSGVKMSSSAPVNWQVTFDPKEIETILAGREVTVTATVKADKRAIPGDYMTNFEARTPDASSKASFRMSVRTPVLWGWIGILIILAGIGAVWYLFRKYGRR